ncbi:response regulator [Clostridioides difficile]|uniref:response regulator n=1 Tax=Clostridioides difficile TaxID=1496 RepID=UPI001F357F71|nr:response regulator [Clostridioides difficile]
MYNLLVVDDDVDILNINQIYFSNIGFNVYTSETAKDAMDIVERIVLDCIILDISLPDIDGYKMCNDIKEKVNIPIIFLSNYEHEEEKVRGFLAGGNLKYYCF